ncbi:MAG: hypothetical protein V9G19_08910 [Tetrasphaera sp.]
MRWIGRILGGVLALVLVVYLAMNLYAWFSAKNNKNAARERLTTQLTTALPAAREHQRQIAEALGPPDHSWRTQRCDVKTHDVGWMVQNYRQECQLQAIDAYAADSLEEARARLAAAPAELVGDPSDEEAIGRCTTIRARADDGSGQAGDTSVASVLVGPDPGGSEYWCGAGFAPSQYRPEQVVSGDHVSLDGDRSWLVVSRMQHLGSDSIGCSRWTVLFCSEPSGLPVFGSVNSR